MIQLSRNYSLPEQQDEVIPIKVIGVGGAGLNALDRIVLDGLERGGLDRGQHRRAIARQLGRGAQGAARPHESRAGWAPEAIPRSAMTPRSKRRMKSARRSADARMIFVCAGLGGGTGSGAAPVIARAGARERRAGGRLSRRCRSRSRANAASRRREKRLQRLRGSFGCGGLFRERPDGRHGGAESGHAPGVRRRRHHHQPKRARDREPDPAARADPDRLRRSAVRAAQPERRVACSASANRTPTIAPMTR